MTDGTEPTPQGQPRVVTPEEIQHQEFGVSRFGGYRMRDVDEFLDQLTASTQALQTENERLRAGGGPILGTPDLEEVNRQADEIVQRAREEAQRILADASARAAVGQGGAAAPEERVAVDAFLTQERDFLQDLAALVQGHAETVKAMARRARQAPAEEPAEEPVDVEADDAEPGEVAEADPAPDQPTQTDVPIVDVDDRVVRVDEPPERRDAPARDDEDASEGDPSLRALFWGDD
jgi:DivIVA domain-containing protein